MRNDSGYFENLAASVQRVAHHAYYPGIDQAIDQCLQDINELLQSGRITAEQFEALRPLLEGVRLSASSKMASAA
jgi:hypothetical protein